MAKNQARFAGHGDKAAMIECEVLAIVEHLGQPSFPKICASLPHLSQTQIKSALQRQKGVCLINEKRKGWRLA